MTVTPNFEDEPIEIKAGWRGTIIAHADKPTPCIEFNEKYRGNLFWRTWTLPIRKWSGNQDEQGRLPITLLIPRRSRNVSYGKCGRASTSQNDQHFSDFQTSASKADAVKCDSGGQLEIGLRAQFP